MILYLLFYVIAWSFYKGDYGSFFKLSFIAHFVFVLFLIEVYAGNVTYYISDELKYINNPENWIIDKSRATWGYINYFEKYHDLFGFTFAKIINIPLLLIFNKLLQNLFKSYLGKLNIIILLPYFFFLGISNLRDILIIISVLSVITFFYKQKIKYYLIATLFFIVLFTLRPFIALVLLFVLSYYLMPKTKTKMQIMKYILFFSISVFLIFEIFSYKIDQYYYNLTYYLSEGLEERIKLRRAEVLGDSESAFFWLKAHLRYAFTPMPHSIISSLYDGAESFTYGLTSKILRLINQIIYFGFLVYSVLNFSKLYSVFKNLNSSAKSFLLISFSYLPIYSFLHFGGVHQRTKLPFQVAIIIIGLLIWRYKRLKNARNK
ncbi:hypothetical protein OA870_04395 [Bacteroidota bacterium]|nr:hypothetical protein [Bacteroidota bacterium]